MDIYQPFMRLVRSARLWLEVVMARHGSEGVRCFRATLPLSQALRRQQEFRGQSAQAAETIPDRYDFWCTAATAPSQVAKSHQRPAQLLEARGELVGGSLVVDSQSPSISTI